jgi:hypothetical protein
MITFERWEEGGYYIIKEDSIGLSQTKSRNVARRVCDALNAPNLLVGRTVKKVAGTEYRDATQQIIDQAVVLAISSSGQLIVRFSSGQLAEWPVMDCKIIEPLSEVGLPLDNNGKPIEDPPFRAPSLLSDADVKLIVTALAAAHPVWSAQLRHKLCKWQWPDYPSMWEGKFDGND